MGDCLVNITNSILKLKYFPEAWKKAVIKPIPKPGKNSQIAENLRPISLLSTIGKIIEKVILKRISVHLNKNNILRNEQFGFRHEHSTTAQLARLTDHITKCFNNKMHTGLILLDIQKAFDTLWHDGLIFKLDLYKFPPYLIEIMYTYINNRSFAVKVDNSISKYHIMPAGLPQGSALSAVLFIIYTNDIPNTKNVHLSLYADDTAAYTSSYRTDTIHNRLNTTLTKINRYFTKWKIKINNQKTQAIIFTKRRPNMPPQLITNGTSIKWNNKIKYLGLIFDRGTDIYRAHYKHMQ